MVNVVGSLSYAPQCAITCGVGFCLDALELSVLCGQKGPVQARKLGLVPFSGKCVWMLHVRDFSRNPRTCRISTIFFVTIVCQPGKSVPSKIDVLPMAQGIRFIFWRQSGRCCRIWLAQLDDIFGTYIGISADIYHFVWRKIECAFSCSAGNFHPTFPGAWARPAKELYAL